MSALDPRLPGTGITFRITRDDGITFAGVTIPAEVFTISNARAKLAAAPGLSAPEITRANNITYAGFSQPRYGNAHNLFTAAAAAAALNTTAGLSAAEQARIAAAAL